MNNISGDFEDEAAKQDAKEDDDRRSNFCHVCGYNVVVYFGLVAPRGELRISAEMGADQN